MIRHRKKQFTWVHGVDHPDQVTGCFEQLPQVHHEVALGAIGGDQVTHGLHKQEVLARLGFDEWRTGNGETREQTGDGTAKEDVSHFPRQVTAQEHHEHQNTEEAAKDA
jgi:hypothetical protein